MAALPDHPEPACMRTSAPLRLPAHWPYDVRRLPFFYGWAIWGLATLGILLSIPGQTMGMAVFTDPFMDAFGLSRTQLSIAYFIGTVGSSLFLTRAGRWYDRHQARTLIVAACGVLAAVLLLLSGIDLLIAGLAGTTRTAAAFTLALLGYFGVRFAGQGVLTSSSRNMLLMWFERRRGLVSGTSSVVVALSFSIAPLLLALLIDAQGWRGALWTLAAVLTVFAGVFLLTVRDTPEHCGLLPDGRPHGSEAPGQTLIAPDRTLDQARRSPVFWLYSGALAMHALFGTAVTFHIVAIFEEAGRGRAEAFAYFLPQAIVSTTVNLSASLLADRVSLKPFLVLMLAGFILGSVGLLTLATPPGYAMLVAGFGIGGGLWGVLSNLGFIRHFGRLHLGEISGFNASITVFGSAVGPLLFSLGVDLFGTYAAAVGLCLGLNALLLLVALRVNQAEPGQRAAG